MPFAPTDYPDMILIRVLRILTAAQIVKHVSFSTKTNDRPITSIFNLPSSPT
ncbi:hypothetical protein [Okeania sp. SIO2B3]|uniref:hypothetical protein n=1 Tax=Okeania sp. SIO2B3 TaxID=2607784 RepID=UPI0013BFC559|nr:hypothetical protein [Okeania sp. SIO2B3]NET43385.1 hypothetical protein [Okeania sp. SIO2B3]